MTRFKCRARIPNKWYDEKKWGGEPDRCHPCPFKAILDGYCERHHPEALLLTLERKEAALAEELADVRQRLEAIRRERDRNFPLNPT
jgi:hypothetical protein